MIKAGEPFTRARAEQWFGLAMIGSDTREPDNLIANSFRRCRGAKALRRQVAAVGLRPIRRQHFSGMAERLSFELTYRLWSPNPASSGFDLNRML